MNNEIEKQKRMELAKRIQAKIAKDEAAELARFRKAIELIMFTKTQKD